jgi:transposase
LEPGSPFGQSIAPLVVYLHYAHAIGMERLATLLDEIFSLTLSEGAISNILARAREPLLVAATTIRATVLASPVVCSDETSARGFCQNLRQWRRTEQCTERSEQCAGRISPYQRLQPQVRFKIRYDGARPDRTIGLSYVVPTHRPAAHSRS